MKFWRENRDVLLFGKLFAYNPESGYSQVGSQKNGNAVITCYTNNFIDVSAYNKTIVVNSSKNDSVIIKGAINKNYSVVNCMGENLSSGQILTNLTEIQVPLAGIVIIE